MLLSLQLLRLLLLLGPCKSGNALCHFPYCASSCSYSHSKQERYWCHKAVAQFKEPVGDNWKSKSSKHILQEDFPSRRWCGLFKENFRAHGTRPGRTKTALPYHSHVFALEPDGAGMHINTLKVHLEMTSISLQVVTRSLKIGSLPNTIPRKLLLWKYKFLRSFHNLHPK